MRWWGGGCAMSRSEEVVVQTETTRIEKG